MAIEGIPQEMLAVQVTEVRFEPFPTEPYQREQKEKRMAVYAIGQTSQLFECASQ